MEIESTFSSSELDVVIGLGANLGARRETLRRAVAALGASGGIRGVSALYETAPVGGPPQPEFLNAAVRLCWAAQPPELLARLLEIERSLGRERRERWGPRTLDLDILWGRGLVWKSSELTVPHPRLREREFALRPFLDVAPDAVDPEIGLPYAQVLASIAGGGVVLVERCWVDGWGACEEISSLGMDSPGR